MPATEDIASSFEDAWAGFQARESLVSVADTLEAQWAHGRAQYLAFLVRIEDRSAQEYLSRVCDAIAGIPGVEPYPEWYWHATVKGAGFQVIKRTREDDVLRQDVPSIAGKARTLLKAEPAFEARLGPVGGFPEVVFAEVHDRGRFRELNTRLGEAIPQLYHYPIDGGRFLPHVSVARFHSDEGLPQLKETLATLRSEGPGPSITIGRIEFIKAWLSEETPEFETLASYALAAPGRSA